MLVYPHDDSGVKVLVFRVKTMNPRRFAGITKKWSSRRLAGRAKGSAMRDSVFIYSPSYQTYMFHQEHPFNQRQVLLTYDLLKTINAFDDGDIVSPRLAAEEELALVHTDDYIQAVKLAGAGKLPAEEGESYGLGTEDTPVFAGMHEVASLLVGGTLTAADWVMSGQALHAANLGGGLHHGFRGRASGFCIYNDSAVAIQYIQKNTAPGYFILIPTPTTGTVCNLRFTITLTYARCLFMKQEGIYSRNRPSPGKGSGKGYGYSFNIPLDAFTEDDSFLEAYQTATSEVAAYFQPDVIISQNGADAHYYDPLTHLSATINIYEEIPGLHTL